MPPKGREPRGQAFLQSRQSTGQRRRQEQGRAPFERRGTGSARERHELATAAVGEPREHRVAEPAGDAPSQAEEGAARQREDDDALARDAARLAQECHRVADELEHRDDQDAVEGAIREGKLRPVGADDRDAGARDREHRRLGIGAHHPEAEPGEGRGEVTRAAAELEQARRRRQRPQQVRDQRALDAVRDPTEGRRVPRLVGSDDLGARERAVGGHAARDRSTSAAGASIRDPPATRAHGR